MTRVRLYSERLPDRVSADAVGAKAPTAKIVAIDNPTSALIEICFRKAFLLRRGGRRALLDSHKFSAIGNVTRH